MERSRRHLPHQYRMGTWQFITWCLHGSLPRARYPPPSKLSSGAAFVWMDRYLDCTRNGPMYLKQSRIATIIVDSLQRGVLLGHYDLGPYVIMPNHVHALLLPKISPPRLMRTLKGSTARQANEILGRTGDPFWQAESYDHCVRDEREFLKIQTYIENNPVKAGLASAPGEYQWSSASKCVPMSGDAAGTSACAT